MKSMHVLYNTTTYNGERFELFVLLSLSLPDDSRFRFLPFKASVLGADFSNGEVGDVLCDDAEAKSESESDSDELEGSKMTRPRWAIMMAEGLIHANT
jgi:hypothetical protein